MIRSITVLLLIFLASVTMHAQSLANDSVNLRSPYNTILSHLHFLQYDTYQPELAAKTIRAENPDEAQSLAIKLKQVLDAKGLYIDLETLPKDPEYIDSLTKQHRYILFPSLYPDIYVERIDGHWQYSRRTAIAIPGIHSQIFPFGSDLLMNMFPPGFGQRQVGVLQMWQIVGIFLFVVLIVIVHGLLSIFLQWLIVRFEKRFNQFKSSAKTLKKTARPFSLFLITIMVIPFEPILQLPVGISRWVVLAIKALTPFFLTLTLYRAVDILGEYLSRLAERTENKLDDQLVPLVRKALKVFVIIIGGIYILQNLDFNVTALIAGISVGGIALALAAQDTLKNFFGSLMIFLDKPFHIGDWINFGGVDGMVEEVGFRATRVRTFHNSLVYVPNGKLADMTIDNYGLRMYRRFSTKLALTYDTPTPLIQSFVDGLKEIVKNHPKTRKDYYEIHLNDLNSHSIDILFYIFFHVPSWSEELKARHEVISAVIDLAQSLGVRFAFPTQTIHVEDLPGQKGLSPVYDTELERMQQKTDDFVKKYKARYVEEPPGAGSK